jgi:hypothetical protein
VLEVKQQLVEQPEEQLVEPQEEQETFRLQDQVHVQNMVIMIIIIIRD